MRRRHGKRSNFASPLTASGEWDSPIWKHWLAELTKHHRLVRYDERGNGLSQWDVKEMSLELWVRDLEMVVEAAGVERFALLGISQGGLRHSPTN